MITRYSFCFLLLFIAPLPPLISAANEEVKMRIFENIQDIEKAALTRFLESNVETVPMNKDVYLSSNWSMKKVVDFYSRSSGGCRYLKSGILTCTREKVINFGKFLFVISFKQSKDSVFVVEYVVLGVK